MKNIARIISLGTCLGLLTAATVTSFTGCTSSQNSRSTGQYIDDKSLQHQVRDALSDNPEYKFSDVNVDVYRGTCQLSGFVDSSDQKSKAGEIAKNIQGVSTVDNNITVRSSSSNGM